MSQNPLVLLSVKVRGFSLDRRAILRQQRIREILRVLDRVLQMKRFYLNSNKSRQHESWQRTIRTKIQSRDSPFQHFRTETPILIGLLGGLRGGLRDIMGEWRMLEMSDGSDGGNLEYSHAFKKYLLITF